VDWNKRHLDELAMYAFTAASMAPGTWLMPGWEGQRSSRLLLYEAGCLHDSSRRLEVVDRSHQAVRVDCTAFKEVGRDG